MKLIKIKPALFEEVPLRSDLGKLHIEIVADDDIDCGILDDENYHLFVGADTEEDVKKLKWFEEVTKKQFTFAPPADSCCWLILWNAYSNKSVSVAYEIEPAE